MEIKELEYVRVDALNLEQLGAFEKLCHNQGYDISEPAHDVYNFWRHYGVYCGSTQGYDTAFENHNGVDITEQFLNYLNSLEGVKDAPNVEDHETQETTTEYLTVKERLLALADGKELEWWHEDFYEGDHSKWLPLKSFLSAFGEILYDDECKVRVKLYDPIKDAYDKLDLNEDMTTFDIFKAGYDAAKEND